MLRGILRNVQYYLLFFSTLLVLLAFQRLRWFDQVFPHPYYLDRPFHHSWRGTNSRSDGSYTGSSPDDAGGRIFYGGDESREIGLFRFRLGLFKFVLPMFSSPASWERTSELSSLITVPPPPNKMKRRSNDGHNLRAKLESQIEKLSARGDGELKQRAHEQEATNSSVAYIVIIDADFFYGSDQWPHDSARALSKSIEAAHQTSPYDYQLYALNLMGGAPPDDNAKAPDGAHEQLAELGFRTIKEEGDLHTKDEKRNTNDTKGEQSLQKVLGGHDIIAQISIDSLMLRPMDDLFDALLERKTVENLIGVLDKKKGNEGGGIAADEKQKGSEQQSTPRVDSFILEPVDALSALSSTENELVIFHSKSQQAVDSYLESLECIAGRRKGGELQLQHAHNASGIRLKPRLSMVARKTRQISQRANQRSKAIQKSQCSMQGENSLQLDRCMYDSDMFDASRGCSHVNAKDDARVTRFRDHSSPPGDKLSVESKAGAKTEDSNEASRYCTKMLSCSGGDCLDKPRSHDQIVEMCQWLYDKRLSFVGNSKP